MMTKDEQTDWIREYETTDSVGNPLPLSASVIASWIIGVTNKPWPRRYEIGRGEVEGSVDVEVILQIGAFRDNADDWRSRSQKFRLLITPIQTRRRRVAKSTEKKRGKRP